MGYTYVTSDIHGMAFLLEEMLEKIGFSDADTLYILGDMIDRGPDPAGVLDLAASQNNIIALMGNHEEMFIDWYEHERMGRSGTAYTDYYYNTYEVLMSAEKSRAMLPEYVRWMKSLPACRKVMVNGDCWLLAHASTEPILQVWKGRDSILWGSNMVERGRGIPGYFSIVGHVPTFILRGYPPEPATIWHSKDKRLIDVDCGAVFTDCGGRLGCYCLETGEEFYVASKEII